ncbi:MAG: lytic transglycosylase domain-containing protein [Paracoccaceae bacterium]|tara:strand:+ start:24 stop:1979 length:1956 start_codon:yes stop_codon:yes gene_type:complete
MKSTLISFFTVILLSNFLSSSNAKALEDSEILRKIIDWSDNESWQRVDVARGTLVKEESRAITDWLRLRGEQGTFDECIKFLKIYFDWPGLKLLRKRCEQNIPRGGAPEKVIKYFSMQKPQTGTGSLRYAEALIKSGRSFEASQEIKRTWKDFDLDEEEHNAYVERNSLTIKNLHYLRMDSMLWQGFTESASRMLPLVGKNWQALARARIALRKNRPRVNYFINLVPKEISNDPGLAYERFLWRLRNGHWNGAIEIIIERSASEKILGQPLAWADWRRVLAREMMRSGQFEQAYRIASKHYLRKGPDFADLEWLSGFIALKKLTIPETSLVHFKNFSDVVDTPISLGRSGYWLGLTYKALNDEENSQKYFSESTKSLSSFYGQLSVNFLKEPDLIDMSGREVLTDWRDSRFSKSSVLKAAIQVSRAGSSYLTERLLVHLSEKSTREEFIKLAGFAAELGETHVSLMITKQAAREGFQIFRTYYPLELPHNIKFNNKFEKILPLSIIRRESEFDPEVISPVGARGLMQLMPKTAQEMAGKIGVPYSRKRLISDPTYNVRLGIAYLNELSERFGGNIILVAAAYNAGPTRLDRWLTMFGDPRSENIDVIDWIEDIPYRETRNYVMRVAESLLPYEARLKGAPVRKDLYRLIKD